jgi:hypothetical protein
MVWLRYYRRRTYVILTSTSRGVQSCAAPSAKTAVMTMAKRLRSLRKELDSCWMCLLGGRWSRLVGVVGTSISVSGRTRCGVYCCILWNHHLWRISIRLRGRSTPAEWEHIPFYFPGKIKLAADKCQIPEDGRYLSAISLYKRNLYHDWSVWRTGT